MRLELIKNMNNIIISIILPARNEEKYIKSSIESILTQTFRDFELIIINDASDDQTKTIVEQYASIDKRIRILNNKSQNGVARSLNRGIDMAKGRYIARIDAGDIANLHRLEKQFKYIEQNQNIAVVGSWSYIVDEKYNIIGKWMPPLRVDSGILYNYGGIIHSSVMFRKDIIEFCGKYDPHYVAEDYELWLRIIKNGFKIMNIPDFLVSYLERTDSISIKNIQSLQISTFKIKLEYLPNFFNLHNFIHTLRSLAGTIVLFLGLKREMLKYSYRLNRRIYNL